LKEINTAIKATKRLGEKPPIFLLRFKAALEYEMAWLRKRKLAETKLKKYRKRVKYYEKRIARFELLIQRRQGK